MFIVNYVFNCNYILCINLDCIWVSCMIWGLNLLNRLGENLFYLDLNLMLLLSGYYMVNRDGDLIYIGYNYKLLKIFKEN